jgi:lysozyme
VGLKSKAAAGSLVLAVGIITAWEGYNPEVYVDPVGIPTVCYGHVVNSNVPLGTRFSVDACHNLLYSDLKVAVGAVDHLVKVPLEDHTKAAIVSFVYNVGIGNFKKSTMLKLLNENRISDACHELPRWVYAKKKKLKGLVNRRQAEMELCLGKLGSTSN